MKPQVLNADTREAIFVDIIYELWKYSTEGVKDIVLQKRKGPVPKHLRSVK